MTIAKSAEPAGWVTHERRAMGSALRLTTGPDGALAAWRLVDETFEAAEAAMSRFRATSELTELNALAGSGVARSVSPMLRQALVAADRATRLTGGRFDGRVLADLDRLGYRGAPLATPAGETAAIGGGSDHMTRDGTQVVERLGRERFRLARPVDLGGIGKGLALRWAAHRLDRLGARAYLLEAGGDLVARGSDGDARGWMVGIEDPLERVEHLAVMEVADLAVATSSVAVHRWSAGGRTVHHLIDPSNGEPRVGGLAAVTVAWPDPAWAEVWSKALFLSGAGGVREEASRRGLAAWWVTDGGDLEMSPAARALTAWTWGLG